MDTAEHLLQTPGGGISLHQVMSPSAQEAIMTTPLAMREQEPSYGAAAGTMNGAASLFSDQPRNSQDGLPNPNVYDPAPSREQLTQLGGSGSANPDRSNPLGEPQQERGDVVSQAASGTSDLASPSPTITFASTSQQPHGLLLATSQFEAQGSSTRPAEQPPQRGAQQSVVRWMTRLTESLRMITTRSNGGTEHVAQTSARHGMLTSGLDAHGDLEMTTGPPATATDAIVPATQSLVTFSPPEELRLRDGLPIPATWSQVTSPQGAPLFTRDQIRRLEESQARSSLLRHPATNSPPQQGLSDENSTHSSLVQAEVQRQLEGYDQRQREEIFRLQQEIFNLRAQREALAAPMTASSSTPPRRISSPSLATSLGNTVARAVLPLLPASLVGAPLAAQCGQAGLPDEHRALTAQCGQAGLPDGHRALTAQCGQAALPDGHRAFAAQGGQAGLPEGHRALTAQCGQAALSDGHRAYAAQGGQAGLPAGHRALTAQCGQAALSDGHRAYAAQGGQAGVPDGHRALAAQCGQPGLPDGHRALSAAQCGQPGLPDGHRALSAAQCGQPGLPDGHRALSAAQCGQAGLPDAHRALSTTHCGQSGLPDGHRALSLAQCTQPGLPDGQRVNAASNGQGYDDGQYPSPSTVPQAFGPRFGANGSQPPSASCQAVTLPQQGAGMGHSAGSTSRRWHYGTRCIDVQDWLELVAAPMSDLSNTSSVWWARVRELANETYKRWTKASPIERLNIQPPVSSELEGGRWARVNARASSMIMSALDSSVASEIVARRLTQSTPALLFRLMTLYQPGGEYEKGWVLRQLQAPDRPKDATTALETLRSWSRWLRRSEDLGLAKPDPTILARGLTSIVQQVLEGNYEANFRTSLIRNSLRIDTVPTNTSIQDYLHHLLAEMEGMVNGSGQASTSVQGLLLYLQLHQLPHQRQRTKDLLARRRLTRMPRGP